MRLPARLKEVVPLYCFQDMTVRKTADALSISPSTALKRLHDAHERLRGLLEERDSRG